MSFASTLKHSLSAALLATCVSSFAADVRIPLSTGGALVLPVPEGWRSGAEPGPVPTLSLSPAKGARFQVLVSPLVSRDGRVGPSSAERLRQVVISGRNSAMAQAVEESISIQDLKGPHAEGTYFSATDRAPKPGEFKYMTQGAMSVSGLPVTFTILTNDDSKSSESVALRMLRTARRE